MGYYDRPYRHEPTGPGSLFGGSGGAWSMTVILIAVNVVVHLIAYILLASRYPALSPLVWGNFNLEQGLFGLQIWRFFTYQFLHDGFMHILFNMIVLFFFGRMMEDWLGSRRFLAFYLLCGCSGALLFSMLAPTGLIGDPEAVRLAPLIGASGSVYGVLIGCAVVYPTRIVHVWAIFPMQIRTIAFIILGIAFFTFLVQGPNLGGEAAHLGGAALGFLLTRKPHWLDFADRMPWQKLAPHSMAYRLHQKRIRRRLEREEQLEREVDRILDKVARNGLHSLTRREKKVLQQATEQRRES